MSRLEPTRDIQPVTEFRANAAQFIEQVRDTGECIAKDRPQAAAAWLEALIERVAALDKFAKRGRIVPELGKATHRQVLHYPYRIIYRIDASQVVILTRRHGRRAWDPDEVAPGA